jgi:hypothetical protein
MGKDSRTEGVFAKNVPAEYVKKVRRGKGDGRDFSGLPTPSQKRGVQNINSERYGIVKGKG